MRVILLQELPARGGLRTLPALSPLDASRRVVASGPEGLPVFFAPVMVARGFLACEMHLASVFVALQTSTSGS